VVGPVERLTTREVHSRAALRRSRWSDLAIDRPDEGRELAGDRHSDDRWLSLAVPKSLGWAWRDTPSGSTIWPIAAARWSA
jgi:hypothetical protein